MPFKVLIHHRDHTNREVTRNASADLEKANSFASRIIFVPISQPHHIFNTCFHGRGMEFAFYTIGGENISHSAVFPARNYDREILFGSGQHPRMRRINFIIAFHHPAQKEFIHKFVRKKSLALGLSILPYLHNVVLYLPKGLFFGNTSVGHTI